MEEKVTNIPDVGWKVRMDHVFPQKRSQFRFYGVSQLLPMLSLFWRYLVDYIWKMLHGKTPVMDFFKAASCDQQSGVPIGGIGGGTIGRGFRGEFSRYQIVPGVYEFPSTTVEAAQFIVNIQNSSKNTVYQRVLSCQRKPRCRLSSWMWNFPENDAEYTALYPRSWTVFNIREQNIKLICRQISPVIPNNYKDSSIPGAVFHWTAYNYCNEQKYISITFTFQSGTGTKKYKVGEIHAEAFEKASIYNNISGILIKQKIQKIPLTYGIAALAKESVKVTSIFFNPNSNGKSLWKKLETDGELNSDDKYVVNSGKTDIGSALCTRTSVNPNDFSTFVFSLVWDNPIIKFPQASKAVRRYYTKYFGDSGNAAPDMCLYCFDNYSKWEVSIHKWQASIIENKNIPDWYKSALFNELYYISDGGTVWLLVEENLPEGDPRKDYGRFAYLEGHEYRMYNTYDVHFYASFALAMLWPKLQLSIQYDFRDAIISEDKTTFWFLYDGKHGFRKIKNTTPHDLGDPEEAPFDLINIYNIHDVSNWKDLNLKFVLQVYRDFVITSDISYLNDMFPQALLVMKHALTWGTEEDGMIKNSGFPDQTYDAWTMSGVSAYCGSLWLASLAVFIKMAKLVNQISVANDFSAVFEKAKVTFEKKLWNGHYFNFDSSEASHSNSIMADQLCGLWYLHSCKVSDEVFAQDKVKLTLQLIYKMNVCNYFGGQLGAVNGMFPNGKIDKSAVQSEEVWTGVTYALASLLVFEGFMEEGFSTAKGLYETVYNKSGLGFATPEGLVALDGFRAIAYMRPLSIWSMQLALENSQTY